MKKGIFICLLMSFWASSQTNRFLYDLQYRKDSTEDYRKCVMALDINPTETKFYDYKFAEYDAQNKASSTGNVSRYSTKTDQVVVRKPNSFTNDWYRDFFDYFVVKSDDEMTWKLSPETKIYNNYNLQKATTNFGGRSWTAWFCKDIEIKEGPYKFRGLPGLIFIVEDSLGDFTYHLISNTKLPETYDTKDFVETHYGKVAISISNSKFNKYLEDAFADPVRMFSGQIKNGGKATFDKEVIETPEALNSKKIMLQKGIKKRYIFIEKDKAPTLK